MKQSSARLRAGYPLFIAVLILATLPGTRAQTFISPEIFIPGSGPSTLRRTVHDAVDFGSDGRIELRVVDEVEVRRGGGQRRQYVEPAPGVTLVGSGFVMFKPFTGTKTNAQIATASVGLIVDPTHPPEPAPQAPIIRWLRIYNSVTSDGGGSGLGAAVTEFHVGAIFPAADGRHAGWVHFVKNASGKWVHDAAAWNPQPEAPLAVGSLPTPAPDPTVTYTDEYVTPTSPDGLRDRDITLGKRSWTNHTDHTHGLTIDVRGHSEWQWWTRAIGDTNVAVGIPERTPLPGLPADPAGAWTTVSGGVVLLRASYDVQGQGGVTGPLAAGTPAFAVFRTTGYQGWVQASADLADFRVARLATAVGARELPLSTGYTATAANLDLNHDGLVDFVQWDVAFRNFDDQSTTQFLDPLTGSGILAPLEFLPPDAAVPVGSDTVFDTTLRLYFSTFINGFHEITHNGLIAPTGLFGFRFLARDGTHYGWARLTHADNVHQVPILDPLICNPWPGEAIPTGAPAPAPLRAGRTGANASGVRIAWPALLPVTLQRYDISGDRVWTPATPTGPGEFVPEAGDATGAAFFRLVAKP